MTNHALSTTTPVGDLWHPPVTFRDGLEATERLASELLDQLAGQLVVPVSDLEFLARRLHQLARDTHRALPPEVT